MRTGRYRMICIVTAAVALLVSLTVPVGASRSAVAPAAPPTSDAVAVVDGSPITLATYRHWLVVATDGNAQNSPGSPRIIPLAPPRFAGCIAQVRAKIPTLAKTPDAQIRADCRELFTALNKTVLDFLIKGAWYRLEVARLHITVTDAQVEQAFQAAKHRQFPNARAYKKFLRTTGQTAADIRYRVRTNLYFKRLEARHAVRVTPAAIAAYYHAHRAEFSAPGGKPQSLAQATPLIRELLKSQAQQQEQTAVDQVAAQHWQASTSCRPLYVIADCAGAPAGAAAR